MSFSYEEIPVESPYVVGVAYVHAETDIMPICRAESRWELIITTYQGYRTLMVAGPTTRATTNLYPAGMDFIVIKFKIGFFMPHLPISAFVNTENALPDASSRSFWLDSSVWQFPDTENVDTFINRLIRKEVVIRDPVVPAALQNQFQAMSSRTLRRRFLRATGLPEGSVRQIDRAQQAVAMLEQGTSILDTVHQAGYADQPHLTRSMKRFMGQTPDQILRTSKTL